MGKGIALFTFACGVAGGYLAYVGVIPSVAGHLERKAPGHIEATPAADCDECRESDDTGPTYLPEVTVYGSRPEKKSERPAEWRCGDWENLSMSTGQVKRCEWK